MLLIILGVISLVLAALTIWISVRSFLQKGFLFHNAYIFASEQQRKTMDKRPYYRQSAIAFLLIGLIFILMGIGFFLSMGWVFFLAIAVGVAMLSYVIVSDQAIAKL